MQIKSLKAAALWVLVFLEECIAFVRSQRNYLAHHPLLKMRSSQMPQRHGF